MKILVTGATGFVGQHVIEALLQHDMEIVATGRSEIWPAGKIPGQGMEYIPADLNQDRNDWFSFFKHPDLLIHLAWEGLPNYMKLYHLERNLPGNYRFLKSMMMSGLGKMVVTGTCFEYGLQDGPLKEDLPTHPVSSYALAKDGLRKGLEQLQREKEFDLIWIRLFYMYGPGQGSNSILSLLEAALERGDKVFNMSGGEQLRDYLPVRTMANYIVDISLQNKIFGIVNCCSGNPISIRKLVENYLAENHRQIDLNLGHYPYPEHEPMAFWGDPTKLNRILNTKGKD